MSYLSLRTGTLALLLTNLVSSPVVEKPLPEAEIARRGKAATALLLIADTRAGGSAFCVHPSGYFVTAEHVLRGIASDVPLSLVLDPGLKTEKVLKARVVRTDKELALLYVQGAQGLPTLSVKSCEKLTELMDLFVFGYASGVQGVAGQLDYPSVSVVPVEVKSLRSKKGYSSAIEVEGVLAAGFIGGPVLDDEGRAVGLVQTSSRLGARAISGDRVLAFLAQPTIQLTPPTLSRATIHQPAAYRAQVTQILPDAKAPDVELLLQAADEPERRFKMERRDGMYEVTAAAVLKEAAPRLEVGVLFTSGAVTGLTSDREVQVGGKPVRLSSVSRLHFQPQPRAVLSDGKSLEGLIAGLDKLVLEVGGQQVSVELDKVMALQVRVPDKVALVMGTVVVSQEGKELARLRAAMSVDGSPLVPPADTSRLTFDPPIMTEDKLVQMLPEAVSDVAVGGGGRYLVLHLPRLQKLAIFDVSEARIVRYIPVSSDRAVFAAGLEKVVIGAPEQGRLERWNLRTGEKELAQLAPVPDTIRAVLMGSASHGPVVVNGTFLSLQTLRPLLIETPQGGPGGRRMPVSADGTVFGGWNTNLSPGSSATLVLEGTILRRYDGGEVGHVVPGPDGRMVYTARGEYTNRLATLTKANVNYCLPAVEGSYFLALTPAQGKEGGGLSVYTARQEQPIVKLEGFDHGIDFDGWDRADFGAWKRVFLIPRAKVVALLPPSNDRIVLRRLDVDEALVKSGVDYLIVTSQPPTAAPRGKIVQYQVAAKASRRGVTFRVDGPTGMEISPTGLLTWAVPADFPGMEHAVLVTLRDGEGLETFHSFTLKVSSP